MGGSEGPAATRRIALLLEYDGTAYSGSQFQQNGPSVQQALESASNNLINSPSRVAFAGRTDAGVHARGQVAAVDVVSQLDTADIVRGLNHYLPLDIAVRAAREVPTTFDPRRDARNRAYRYRIDNAKQRPALDRDRAWHVSRPLDVAAMRDAAERLTGKHNFAAFSPATEKITVRTLRRCEVRGRSGGEITVEMEAEAFLPHQMRRTVGPLVEVGRGRMTVEQLQCLLDAAKPSSAQPAAPPQGLYLMRVEYDELDFGLGAEERE
jgi:tRNA pseudouridine38-40 synthase